MSQIHLKVILELVGLLLMSLLATRPPECEGCRLLSLVAAELCGSACGLTRLVALDDCCWWTWLRHGLQWTSVVCDCPSLLI